MRVALCVFVVCLLTTSTSAINCYDTVQDLISVSEQRLVTHDVVVYCPKDCDKEPEMPQVWGCDPYTIDSSICGAALLSGFNGGRIELTVTGLQLKFDKCEKNGMESKAWDDYWGFAIEPKYITDYTTGSGNFNWSTGYKNDQVKEWHLHAPYPRAFINVSITNFNTEPAADYLEIYDGSRHFPLGALSGRSGNGVADSGTLFEAISGTIKLVFQSDNSVTKQGFDASWTSAGESHLTIYPEKLEDECFRRQAGGDDYTIGVFDHGHDVFCRWSFVGDEVKIRFDIIDTEHDWDYVTVYDLYGNLVAMYTGLYEETPVVTVCHGAYVEFSSDFNTGEEGFQATVFVESLNDPSKCHIEADIHYPVQSRGGYGWVIALIVSFFAFCFIGLAFAFCIRTYVRSEVESEIRQRNGPHPTPENQAPARTERPAGTTTELPRRMDSEEDSEEEASSHHSSDGGGLDGATNARARAEAKALRKRDAKASAAEEDKVSLVVAAQSEPTSTPAAAAAAAREGGSSSDGESGDAKPTASAARL